MDLNLRVVDFHIWFSESFDLISEFNDGFQLFQSYGEENVALDINARSRYRVQMDLAPNRKSAWNYSSLSGKEWLAHWMEIYHLESINKVWIQNVDEKFNLEQISETIEGLKIRDIQIELDFPQPEVAFLGLQLRGEKHSMTPNGFESTTSLQKAVIQNAQYLRLVSEVASYLVVPQMTLDEIYLSNASSLIVEDATVSGRDLNRFVRIWMRGGSPRLKMLNVWSVRRPDYTVDVVMKSIKYVNISQEELEEMKTAHGYEDGNFEIMVNGGFSIRSNDGRKATVALVNDDDFTFFVWN